jgi:hypothetical protein
MDAATYGKEEAQFETTQRGQPMLINHQSFSYSAHKKNRVPGHRTVD